MDDFPARPQDSAISVEQEGDSVILSWPAAERSWLNWLPAAFLLFWLAGWAAGECFAVWALFFSDAPWPVRIFLTVWLAGWTFGGATAMLQVYRLVGPTRPARLKLTRHELDYLPERPAKTVDLGQLAQQRSASPDESESDLSSSKASPRQSVMGSLFGAGKPFRCERADLAIFQLEHEAEGNRLRLITIHKNKPLEIGCSLNLIEDREWLCALLNDWQEDGRLRVRDPAFGLILL